MRITNQQAWERVWREHRNSDAIRTRDPHRLPSVDFSKSMVIGIVEKSKHFKYGIEISRIAVEAMNDIPVVTVDYQATKPVHLNGPSAASNVFGFFVIPRYESQLIIRRKAKADWKEVERFHALTPIEATVIATTPPANVSIQDKNPAKSAPTHRPPAGGLNIGFAHDPGQGNYDGVVGSPGDVWNFVDIGTTAVDYMRHPNASGSTARIRVTRHDGEWGINTHTGIFRGYIYHNCKCVDLEATLLDLAPARYRALVYAHGDAPNQNANIEVVVGDNSIGKKATGKDGSWDFRSNNFKEGVQFVSFDFDVTAGETVRFISHRDGSGYSMFNAIQLIPIDDQADAADEGSPPQ